MIVPDPAALAKRLCAYSLDYSLLTQDVFGWAPRPWQHDVLLNPRENHILGCHRQAGKSETVCALAAAVTIDPMLPASTSLIASTGRDHASDLMRRVSLNVVKAARCGLCEIKEQSKHHIVLGDGSRVFSVASTETSTRGWVISGVLVIDEAAFVPDTVISALLPTTAAARGSTLLLSTPNGKAGMFSGVFHSNDKAWNRTAVKASDAGCPLDPDFLVQQRNLLGESRYNQEYEVSFLDSDTSAFSYDNIMAALNPSDVPRVPSGLVETVTDAPFVGILENS